MDLNARKVTDFDDNRLKNLLSYQVTNKIDENFPFDLKLKIRDL